MEIQTISLLATIVAIVGNLLSLNKELSKIGFLGTIKIFSYYSLPILFIQQIIQITVKGKFLCSITILVTSLILMFICYHLKFNKKIMDFEEFIVCTLLFVSSIFFLCNKCMALRIASSTNNIFNIISNVDINNFANRLSEYKISIDMYLFLGENILNTSFVIIDTVSVILFVFTIVKFCSYLIYCYNSDSYNELEQPPNFFNLFKYALILLFLCSGLVHVFVAYIASLF